MSAPVLIRQFLALGLTALVTVAGGCYRPGMLRTHAPEVPPFSESGEAQVPQRWWRAFDDPVLNQQINGAFASNYTLAAALQRVYAARALTRREASDLLPDLDGVVAGQSLFGPGRDRTFVELGFATDYQLDLWGEIEARVDAERFRADATCYDYKALALTLSAEIAGTWFSLIEAHAQVELLEEQIETNRTGLILQEARFGLGLIRSADVLRQRQLLESTLEQAVVAGRRIELLEHQLAVLLGQAPQDATYETGSTLPELPPLPDTGLPSELLHRRPDVRRDYFAFQAANRDLASAISTQYPRVDLTGSLLSISERPEDLFRNWFATIGGQLIAPLFDGGQRRAEVDRTAALESQRFNEYAQTMLIALREVEDALAEERTQRERMTHLREQVELAGESSVQLREQYLIGDVEYLDVLSALTTQQSLQRQLLSAQLELVLIRISLYLALAGDFEPTPAPWQEDSCDPVAGEMEDEQDQDRQDGDAEEPASEPPTPTDEPIQGKDDLIDELELLDELELERLPPPTPPP